MTQRQEIIERLNGLELEGGSHEMLSAICKAVLPHGDAWTLRRCADLRDRLVRLLGEAEQPKERDGRITDELREWWVRKFPVMDMELHKDFTAIANRIDAEHDKALNNVDDAYDSGYNAGYDAGFASADDWLSQHEDAMAEHGWYQALDADKKPVRIGAEMDSDHYEDGTVVGLQFFNTANKTPRALIAICPHGWDVPTWRDPESYRHRHHHAPTVEDVLREFADEVRRCCDSEQTIAEYAKRLTLAGDAE